MEEALQTERLADLKTNAKALKGVEAKEAVAELPKVVDIPIPDALLLRTPYSVVKPDKLLSRATKIYRASLVRTPMDMP